MSSPPRLTTAARVAGIRAAIERVKQAQEHFRQVSANPIAGTLQIESARATLTATVNEFGWQWANVELVLDVLAPKEPA
jgi:hypothetical protein